MFTPGQWNSIPHSEELETAVSPNAGRQKVGTTWMDVVNGEIVMVEGEGSKKSRASRKRPAAWMLDSNNINMSSSSNNNNEEEEEEQPQPQPLSCGSSDQLLPIGSRMGLTESGSWAYSWGGAAQKFDHNDCGGEYNFSTVGMASSGQHSSPGFHRHSPPLSNMANMAPVDCSGRLKSSTYMGGGMVGASSARFHGGFSSGMTATIMPSLHTTSPMSSGASFRAATTTTTTTSLMMSTGSLSPPVCSTSNELSSPSINSTGDGSIIGHGGSGGGQHFVRHLHRIQRKFSAISFDQEMANYESEVAQIVSDNIVRLLPARSMSRPEERILVQEGVRQSSQFAETRSGSTDLSLALQAASLSPNSKRLAAAAGGGKSGSTGKGLLATCALRSPSVGEQSKLGLETSSVSTQSLQNPGDIKVFTWIEPLKFLLRKGLTVSDVGELGRVILPKKDAECHLPQMDNKEGILMAMVDHDCTRQWVFRYKWWLNNKSRMFVLENTGDFMRYHDLKEKDAMTLYKDGVGTVVIHGEKIRNTLTTQQISSVGRALVRDSHNENLTCHVKPNSLPAAIAPEILRLTKSNNTSPRADDLPSSASANATETMADVTPDYTDERLNDPDPTLNWDFGNTSAWL